MTKTARLAALVLLAAVALSRPAAADQVLPDELSGGVVVYGLVVNAWVVAPLTAGSGAGTLLAIQADTDPEVVTFAVCPPRLAAYCSQLATTGDRRVIAAGSKPGPILRVDWVSPVEPQP